MADPNPEPLTQKQLLAKLARGDSLKGVEIGDVDFTGYCFKKKLNFSGAVFTGKTIFKQAQFLNGANFHEATFSGAGRANFRGAEFSGKGGANFSWATFTGDGGANFGEAQFTGEGGANFRGAKFSGEGAVGFVKTGFDNSRWIDFSSIKVENPLKVRFEDVYLGRTSFYQTDIEEFTFKNVKFRETGGRFFKRKQLADEIWNDLVPEEKQRNYDNNHYSHVEILYRQLKRNFEEQRDYARAGDFHYGEMEMRRQQKSPLRRYVSLGYFYKVFSGYGEKWHQALISFLVLLAFFASLNVLWIEPTRDVNIEPREKVIWNWYASPPLEKFGDSLLYTFKVMTLQRNFEFRAKPGVWVGRAAVSVQFLIGPAVIALMILAIRRHFRR